MKLRLLFIIVTVVIGLGCLYQGIKVMKRIEQNSEIRNSQIEELLK